MAKYLDLDGLSRFKGKADAKYANKSELPSAYIKNASIADSTLTLTKQDNTTVTFNPGSADIEGYLGEQLPSTSFDLLPLVKAAMTAKLKYKKWILPQSYQSTHTNCPMGSGGTVEYYAMSFYSNGTPYTCRLICSSGSNVYTAYVASSSSSIYWYKVLLADYDTGIWKHHITLAVNEYNNSQRFLVRFSLINDYERGYYYDIAYSYSALVTALYERGFNDIYHALLATGSRTGNSPVGGIYSDGEKLYTVSMTAQTDVSKQSVGYELPESWVREMYEYTEEFMIGYRD